MQGWAWVAADNALGRVLSRGRILISPEQSRGERYAVLLHELMHVVADADHARGGYDSVVQIRHNAGGSGLRLSELDRMVLQFLYGHLEAGATRAAVRDEFGRSWPHLVAER